MSDTIFDRFSPRPPEPPAQKEPYVAYGLVKPAKALVDIDVYRENGAHIRIKGANLHEVVSTHETRVSLVYDKCIVGLRGRHLTGLIDLLLYFEIRFVERFQSEKHRLPLENHALIDRIRWKPILEADNRLTPAKHVHSDVYLVRME